MKHARRIEQYRSTDRRQAARGEPDRMRRPNFLARNRTPHAEVAKAPVTARVDNTSRTLITPQSSGSLEVPAAANRANSRDARGHTGASEVPNLVQEPTSSAVEPPATEQSTTAPLDTSTNDSIGDSSIGWAGVPEGTESIGQQTFTRTDEPPDMSATTPADAPLAREIADLRQRRAALAEEVSALPEFTRIFTVANQKGGVGKTTTTVNLAVALAQSGARVLVIDLDPQGNASTALGVEHRSDVTSVYEALIDELPMSDVVRPSPESANLFCVPATIHLAGAEIELVSLVAREQRLRSSLTAFLDASPDRFHYVLIDCPPSLGLLTINAFVAATEVLIPIQCEYYALEGLSQLLANIAMIEKHLNPRLTMSTILLTMFDARTNLANQVADDVRQHFPDQVLTTAIPRSIRISEAPSYGQTVINYDMNSAGAVSYREAAAEMARRGAPD